MIMSVYFIPNPTS